MDKKCILNLFPSANKILYRNKTCFVQYLNWLIVEQANTYRVCYITRQTQKKPMKIFLLCLREGREIPIKRDWFTKTPKAVCCLLLNKGKQKNKY